MDEGNMQKKSAMNPGGLEFENWLIWPFLTLYQQMPFPWYAGLLKLNSHFLIWGGGGNKITILQKVG